MLTNLAKILKLRRKILKTIKVNENTYKILIKTSNLTGIGISEIVQNLVKDKVNENILKKLN